MTEKKKVLKASQVLALASKTPKNEEENTTEVIRPLDQENDLGNLLAVEVNEFQLDAADSDLELKLKNLARDNCQLLLNDLWKLPTERVEEAIVANLPAGTTIIPREKPLPKAKPLTKWEKYAKEKGIQKQKKSKLVWDDVVKEWVPRFGYKKAKAETEKNWLMEYKEGQDQDPREKAIEDKRERVAKNELQRLRNIARAKKTKVPGVGLTPTNPGEGQSSDDLKKASQLAKKATASLGKFQEKLPSALEKKIKPVNAKKRKFQPLINNEEKEKNLQVLQQITSKKSKLDVTKAVGQSIHSEEKARASDKKGKTAKKPKKGQKLMHKGKAKGGGKQKNFKRGAGKGKK